MSTLKIPPATIPRDDAAQLHRAFKGMGCDAAIIVNILAHRNAAQRDNIQQEFETLYSYDLRKELSSELHGHLKKAILLWMQNPMDRYLSTLRQALTGPIVDLKAATEIICSRTSSQIRQIKQAYTTAHGTHLEYDIQAHTSGNHKQLLVAYTNVSRYEGPEIDKVLVENDAKTMHKLGEKKFGMDDKILIQIFSERSRSHLVALSSTYHRLYGKELRKAIKKGTTGNFKYALLTILLCAHNPAKYFATVLRKAMKGIGTKDTTLIRIVVTRAEVDMQKIKEEYHKKYKKSLIDAVHSETSSHYRTFLLSLLGSTDR
ncbi:annexin D5 [Mercurialis annua]|uniref:annexin D5 n=1 Tax=Mercurialis annua TaxID=3986 RepID=UPI002160DBA8|nr:annexin D5 [Mercurialis annua]